MKLSNSTQSFLRHLLTAVGTAVATAHTDPLVKAVAGAIAASAAAWGIRDEFKAENPGSGLKLPPGSGGVASILLLVALLSMGVGATLFSGCATTATAPATDTQKLAAYTLTKNATLLVLQRDAGAESELKALSAGIDTVFAAGELKPEQLKAALDALKVSPKSQLLIASALTDAYNLYVAATGKKIVVVTDPTATAILKGVQLGITDGIAFASAFSAPPAS